MRRMVGNGNGLVTRSQGMCYDDGGTDCAVVTQANELP